MGSSILAALGGLSEGFSGTYGKIQDENRKNQAENARLIATSLKQRADTDETLTPDEHDNLYRQYYKTLHPELKPKDIEQLVGTHSYIRTQMAGAMPKPPENAPTGLGGPEDAGISGLPSMPSAPMTMGQAKFNESQPRTVQAEQAKFSAQRQAQAQEREDVAKFNEGKIQEIQGKLDRKEITEAQAEQRLQPYGVKPIRSGGSGAATFVRGTISSEGLQYRLNQEGRADEASAIPPGKFWSVAMDPSKTKTASYTPVVPNTYQGKEATGDKFIDKFPKDWNGQPTNPHELYFPILNRTGGDEIGILPHSLVDTETVHKGFDKIQMKNGGEALVPVTTTTESRKIPAGTEGAQVAPPVPSPSSVVPPDNKPSPGQPTPKKGTTPGRASVGGPIPIEGAGKPLTPQEKIKNEQQARLYNTSIGVVNSLERDLPVLSSMLSTGKIAMQVNPEQGVWSAIINRTMSMSETEKRVAAHWQQLADEILELRIPLGAAAGRNAQMMQVIEANKGILTQNPDIIRKMLVNARSEFQNLRDPIVTAGKKYGFDVEPERQFARDEEGTSTNKKNPYR